MGICLSDVLNDSCFPRTLGSEVKPPTKKYVPDITVRDVFKYLGLFFVFLGLIYFLVIWFRKHKLRFLLRTSLALSCCLTFLYLLLPAETVIHQDYPDFLYDMWIFSLSFSNLMLFVRYHWKKPLNIIKRCPNMSLSDSKREDSLSRNRTRRINVLIDMGLLPPCYPNGWIGLLEARKLEPGQVEGVTALGLRYCVFRNQRGELFILDAFCPHLGADITIGGRVRGDCVECPFHGWHANGRDGVCTRGPPGRIPNNDVPEVPPNVRTKKFHGSEVNGFIYVWYHAEDDQQEPTWEIPRVDPICNGDWKYRGRTEHEVNCHIQEIPENGADLNHLQQLHSTCVLLGLEWMNTNSWLNACRHNWDPEWMLDETRPHIARINLKQTTEILGFKVPFSKLDIKIEQIGPAIVHLHINSFFGRAILTQNIIPEGPLNMRVIHQLYTETAIKPLWADLLLRAEAVMFAKTYLMKKLREYSVIPRPQNSPLRRYIRWYYSQFFSTNSPTYLALQDRTMYF